MASERSAHSTQIIVAVIGLIGVLGAGLLANWDKIFSRGDRATRALEDKVAAVEAEAAGLKAQLAEVTGRRIRGDALPTVRRELTEASPTLSPRLQADLARIFRDPTLSDEERIRHVTLAIRQDIASGDEEQARLVRGLETRSPSADAETLKLKRLLDQRAQQFDMLRQVIDKYNQQAKGTIDSMGR